MQHFSGATICFSLQCLCSNAGQHVRLLRNQLADETECRLHRYDDQNDWIGHMRGHPLAQTPHLDRIAARGTTFLNAHCQAPLCNPSRTSLMLSLRPTTTGIYGSRLGFAIWIPGKIALHCLSTSKPRLSHTTDWQNLSRRRRWPEAAGSRVRCLGPPAGSVQGRRLNSFHQLRWATIRSWIGEPFRIGMKTKVIISCQLGG